MHPELIKKTVYEKENINDFKFKVGHKLLLLQIPKYIKKIDEERKKELAQLKQQREQSNLSTEIDIKKSQSAEITGLVTSLIKRVKNFRKTFNLNLNVSVDNIHNFARTNSGNYKCKIRCIVCNKSFSCFHKKNYWIISNFVAHARSHNVIRVVSSNDVDLEHLLGEQ